MGALIDEEYKLDFDIQFSHSKPIRTQDGKLIGQPRDWLKKVLIEQFPKIRADYMNERMTPAIRQEFMRILLMNGGEDNYESLNEAGQELIVNDNRVGVQRILDGLSL